jgi:hypothetical protein
VSPLPSVLPSVPFVVHDKAITVTVWMPSRSPSTRPRGSGSPPGPPLRMDRDMATGAPLRCGTGGRVEPAPGPRSDRLGEFGERGGDPRCLRGVDGEFVVAASKVLYEGVSSDDHLCCLVRS